MDAEALLVRKDSRQFDGVTRPAAFRFQPRQNLLIHRARYGYNSSAASSMIAGRKGTEPFAI